MFSSDRCYVLLRVGGTSDIVWREPAEIDTLKDFMNAVVVGEGATREEAIRDARPH